MQYLARFTSCLDQHCVEQRVLDSLRGGLERYRPDEDGSLGHFGRVLRCVSPQHFKARRTHDVPWRQWALESIRLVACEKLGPTQLLDIQPLFQELLGVHVPSALCAPTGRLLWTFGARCREVERIDEEVLNNRFPKRASRRIEFLGGTVGWIIGWGLHQATLLFTEFSSELEEVGGVLVHAFFGLHADLLQRLAPKLRQYIT